MPAVATPAQQQAPASASPPVAERETVLNLLIEGQFLSAQEVERVRRVHGRLESPRSLVDVALEMGVVNDGMLREALRATDGAVPLGTLLVELGFFSEAELANAERLRASNGKRRSLTDVLLQEGFMDERRLVEVLSYQYGLPCIDLQSVDLDAKCLESVPLKWCAKHLVLPVVTKDGEVTVVFADPSDHSAREVVEQVFGKDLVAAVATPTALKEAIGTLERNANQVDVGEDDESTAVGIIDRLFFAAVQNQVSDIHIEPTRDRLRIRFRRDGVLIPHKDYARDLAALVSNRIKVLAKADIAEKNRHQGGRIVYHSTRLGAPLDMRVSFYVTVHGEKIVLRLPNTTNELVPLDDLGMSPRLLTRFREDALGAPSGIVIITGPTGSGKTTTLYSAIADLNDIHTSIVTAEDPVELDIDGVAQCSIDPKRNVTFEETLRHMVRQDPDVIVLGEVRDRLSADTAIQAALAGHKVLTTLHTEDTVGALLRLINMDTEAYLVSSTVACVVAQRLLRRVCPDCAESSPPTPKTLYRLGYGANDLAGVTLREGRGCSRCHFTGYRGRVGVFELLLPDEAVRTAILERKTAQEIRRLSVQSAGLVTLLEDGILKAAKGLTSIAEVMRHVPRLSRPRPLGDIKRLLGVRNANRRITT